MWFASWSRLLELLGQGAVVYVALVLLLRVSGKRTLAKLNAFDLVVTIALGSVLASTVASDAVAVDEGIVALALLLGLQLLVARGNRWSRRFRRVVKAQPTIVLARGQFLPDALRKERLTAEEVRAAVRQQGHASLDAVAAVVLETDGSLSVIRPDGISSPSALEGVSGAELLRGAEA